MTGRLFRSIAAAAIAIGGCSSEESATATSAAATSVTASSTGSGAGAGSGGSGAATSSASSGGGGAGGMIDDDAAFAAKRAACEFKKGALTNETFGPSVANANIPIDSFVLVVQENRSFDHYLSKLPDAGQPDVDVAASDATNPDGNGDPISRFHQADYCFDDTNHGWDGMHVAFDDGAMDGFVVASGGPRPMGYFDETDLLFYYDFAKTFGTADRYFCPTLTQTGPNRLYLYGATSLGTITNVGHPAGFISILHELNDKGLPWKVYRNGTYSYEQAIISDQYQEHPENFLSLGDFGADAAADALPALSFVYVGPDEHPPQDMQKGEVGVEKIFATFAASPAWSHAAFIVTYDESGGLYDHVPPPKACAPDDIPPDLQPGQEPGGFDQYGFRVPFMMASAWSKPHYVSHTVHDHTSILRFLQLRFGMPALTARDANANSLIEFFDFSAPSFTQAPALASATVDPAHLCP